MAVLMGVHYPTGQLEQRTNQQCGLTHGTSSHFRWELCFLGGGGRDEGRGAEGPCSEDVPSARWGGLTTFSKTGRFAGFMKSMKKDKQKQFEVILRCFHKNDLVF